MVGHDVVAKLAPLDSPIRRKWWELVALASGRQVLRIISVYGHTVAEQHFESRVRNETLMPDVFEAAVELGIVPAVVAGDFNVRPERSARISNAIVAGA